MSHKTEFAGLPEIELRIPIRGYEPVVAFREPPQLDVTNPYKGL